MNRTRLIIAVILGLSLDASADQFDTLRIKWMNTLITEITSTKNVTSINSKASGYQASITAGVMTGATTGYLWSDLPLGVQAGVTADTASGNIVSTFQRLENMAQAYAIPTGTLCQDATLLSKIVAGLDWMVLKFYTPTATLYGNWYDWEISAPKALENTEVLALSNPAALTTTQIANYCKAFYNFGPDSVNQKDYFWWGALTGANTSNCVQVMAIQGILLGANTTTVTRFWHNTTGHPVNPQTGYTISGTSLLDEARGNLSGQNPLDFSGKNVFAYVTDSDGFYADGSFVFHFIIPYTGQYGQVLLDNIAILVDLLNASTWQITDPSLSNIYSWVTDSFEPLMYHGAMMDMVRGRAIASSSSTEHDIGADVIADIRKVANFAPEPTKSALTTFADSPHLPPGHFHFPGMDRVVAHRSSFSLGLSMSSARIGGYEINTTSPTNLKGWYTGSGMTYLYLGNPDTQFTDDYWATVDWYHLPGTTAEMIATPNDAVTDQSWVGGVQVAKTYGVAGMCEHPAGTNLFARKSWFMLDNEIVCLGAGITSTTAGHQVDTTVENRRMGTASSSTNFYVNGVNQSPALGWSSTLNGVTSCSLDGVAGYYFPGGASNLQASFAANSGAWTTINPNDSDATTHTNNYLKLYFNHGATPFNAQYKYVILPGMNASDTSAYAANPNVSVIANTTSSQAAKDVGLGAVGANFWAAGGGSADLITVNKQASVMTLETYNTISVGVCDPTQTNNGTLTVTLNRAATALISKDPEVTVTQLSPTIILSINVNGSHGKSINASFSQAAQAPVITSLATTTGNQSTVFTYQITASNSPTSYAASNLPNGLTINTGTGLIGGMSTTLGTSNATISATNSGGTGSIALAFTILPPVPVITSSLSLAALNGAAFSYQVTASNNPTSFNATGLPAGLSINTSTGLISGTTTAVGNYPLRLSAAGAGGTGTASATLAVINTATTCHSSIAWTCPIGVYSVQVECWGGGGAGGSAYKPLTGGGNAFGGGGAGGAYTRKAIVPVVAGNTYTVTVGAGGVSLTTPSLTTVPGGDSSFSLGASIKCLGKGGAGGQTVISTTGSITGSGGVGGSLGCIGDTSYAGGSGYAGQGSSGTPTVSAGGGGGGSAGSANVGNNATSNVGALAVTSGGAGGDGRSASGGAGSAGALPGGGGGGARGSSADTQVIGGAGSAGQVTLTVGTLPLSSNANLSGLILSSGTLSPNFASGTLSYTATVNNATSLITVTPTVFDSTATVTVNGTSVTSGSPSAAIALSSGDNTITTVVTAQDETTKIYTVTVTRPVSIPGTVTLGSLLQVFDGSPRAATATTIPSGLTVGFTYNGSSTAPSAVGSYTVVATINDNTYTGSATGTLAIAPVTQTYSSTQNWICPANVTSVQVECWGGGGAGGSASRSGGTSGSVQYGGGGAGGSYAKKTSYAVTPGTTYSINVGLGGTNSSSVTGTSVAGGDSSFNSVNPPLSVVLANGGAGGASAVGTTASTALGAGGIATTTGSLGDGGAVYAGGSGATATGSSPGFGAGGGGSSAGPGSTGVNALTSTNAGTTAPSGGGNGGAGSATSSTSGVSGSAPGGGGGGARNSSGTTTSGGAGGAGQVILTARTTAAPTVISPTSASITAITATLGGNVTNVGGATITERGVVSSITTTNNDPLIGGTGVTKNAVSGTTGVFTVSVSNLVASTGYSSKAYAINSAGTTYTAPVSTFTTLSNTQSWRQQNFGTTANTGNAADSADPDGDGFTNAQEYALGTPPGTTQATLLGAAPSSGNIVFTFTAIQAEGTGYAGLTRYYTIETTADLTNALSWTPVANYTAIVAAGQTVTATLPCSGIGRFYRLKVVLQ